MCLIRTHQHLLGSLGDLQLHDPWHSSTQHPAARGSVLLVGEPAPPFLYASRIFWAQLYLASWEHITRFAGRMEIQCTVKQKDKNHLGLLLSNTELHQNLFKLNGLHIFLLSELKEKIQEKHVFPIVCRTSREPTPTSLTPEAKNQIQACLHAPGVACTVGHNALPTFRKLPVFSKRRAQNKSQTISKKHQSHLQSYERSSKQDGTCCPADPQRGLGRVPSYLIQAHKQVNDDLREHHWIYTSEETPSRELLRNHLYVRTLRQHFKSCVIQPWDSPGFWASPQQHRCFHSHKDGSSQ